MPRVRCELGTQCNLEAKYRETVNDHHHTHSQTNGGSGVVVIEDEEVRTHKHSFSHPDDLDWETSISIKESNRRIQLAYEAKDSKNQTLQDENDKLKSELVRLQSIKNLAGGQSSNGGDLSPVQNAQSQLMTTMFTEGLKKRKEDNSGGGGGGVDEHGAGVDEHGAGVVVVENVPSTKEELEMYDIFEEIIKTKNEDGTTVITKLKKKRLKKKPQRKVRQAINGVGANRALELLYRFRDTSDFLDNFTDENINSLVNFLDILPFSKNDVLIKQNEEASWAGFVLDGDMGVEINIGDDGATKKVATLGTGAIIGELAVLEGGKRTATCIGEEKGGVIGAISFDSLDTLHEEDPELAVKLFTAFGVAGVAKLRSRMTNMGGGSGGGGGGGKEGKEGKDGKDGKDGKSKGRKGKNKRRKINTKGAAKKKKIDGFTASSAAEIFYTSMVAKAERETKLAEEDKKVVEQRIKKMKAKAKTEEILRRRANKKMKDMQEEIERLKQQQGVNDGGGGGGGGEGQVVEEKEEVKVTLASKFKHAAKRAANLKLF